MEKVTYPLRKVGPTILTAVEGLPLEVAEHQPRPTWQATLDHQVHDVEVGMAAQVLRLVNDQDVCRLPGVVEECSERRIDERPRPPSITRARRRLEAG